MKGFKSEWSFKQLFYMLEHLEFSQREMARDIGKKHGSVISGFVNWLDELGFIQKTYEKAVKAPKYEVPSPIALVEFFSRTRKMKDLKIDSFEIGTSRDEVKKILSEKGAIMCLTTALEYSDNYFRDPAIHAYAKNRNIIQELATEQIGGKLKVILYEYDFPDKPKEQDDGVKITSDIRTIMDMFCNDMAYAAEPLIKKVWSHGQ